MHLRIRRLVVFLGFLFPAILVSYCGTEHPRSEVDKPAPPKDPWMGHSDSARYVGITTCKQCHATIYESFIKTGMGQSFDTASHQKSAARFDKHSLVYDKATDFYYHPFWVNNKYYIREFRLEKGDTTYNHVEQVNFIIGSGQHTNSHIMNTNGYLHQMPMTFYTQKGQWDLPPGFENGANTRFSRKIGLECMSCHNAYPDFVQGSENKFNRVMQGVDCERCHGPGSIHVAQKQKGIVVDTTRQVDYSIVNPGKLPVDRQFDVCMRCHLQGDAVLKPGKSFFDFKPGQKLSDFITVFMPKYSGGQDQFIMASHAARLKMSRCFIRSAESTDSSTALRPYRNGLTCVTCHNPHVSVKETGKAVFNSACMHCHDAKKNELDCSASQAQRKLSGDNCVSCHMPRSGSVDIPHVTVHDHFIRKPQTVADSKALKKFIGLYAVNDDHPDRATRAQGFVSYYEKFDPTNRSLLDSAMAYLPSNSTNDIRSNLSGLVQLKFLQHDFQGIKNLIVQAGKDWLMTKGLVHADWANADAWTAYRIGEAYTGLGDAPQALDYYRRATKLASFNLDFENKLAVALMELQKEGEAEKVLNFILSEDNRNVPAYTNLSRLYFLKGDIKNAETYCDKALALDPDHVPALKNKTDCLNAQNKFLEAKTLLQRILKKHPEDADAKTLLLKMKSLKLIS